VVTGVGTAAALALAVVLAWAGVAKAARPRGTAASFAALGVPGPRVLARLVPAVEAGVALALVVRPRAGALAALVLLGLFTVVLARAVRSGTSATCACFGTAASARSVSSVELARNAGLAGLAVAALVPVRPAVPALPDVVLVTVAVALGTVALAALDVRRALGRLWDNRLAGEVAR
jgi:uncharacterized membrane protein YphA (DoxX/SURF4 family)